MHELSIATTILESVQGELQRLNGARLRSVGLRLGEWSGVEPESLRFCFEALARDTRVAGAELVIEICTPRWRCRQCASEFTPSVLDGPCPSCNSTRLQLVTGQELEIAYLDVEGL